jgi:hypothetical protein
MKDEKELTESGDRFRRTLLYKSCLYHLPRLVKPVKSMDMLDLKGT